MPVALASERFQGNHLLLNSPPTKTKTIKTCEAWVEMSSRCLNLTVSLWGAVTMETALERFAKTEAASGSQ